MSAISQSSRASLSHSAWLSEQLFRPREADDLRRPGERYRVENDRLVEHADAVAARGPRIDSSSRREPNPLIGREQELALLEAWFAEPSGPLVITGHGGLGKTALAHEFARTKASLFVDVSSATSFDHVLSAIGEAASLAPDERATVLGLKQAFATRKLELLAIDNIEQLGDEILTLHRLLELAPHVMLTSRVSTGFPLEEKLVLEPLTVAADWTSPSIRLLLRGEAPTAEQLADARALALYSKIATATDGIPLALELAAIQIANVGAAITANQLDERLLDVANESGSRPARHRTMDESIDWSWRFLTETDQRALLCVSLFASTFTFDDAVVAFSSEFADVEERLERLIERSFVVVSTERTGAFRLLVPIREFVRRKVEVGEREAAFRSYTELVLSRSSRELMPFFGTTRAESVFVLERWRADLVQIVEPPFGLVPVPMDVFRAQEALGRLATVGGSSSSYLALFTGDAPMDVFDVLPGDAKASWLRTRARVERSFFDLDMALASAQAALALCPLHDAPRAASLVTLASIDSNRSDNEAAYALALEALELARELGEKSLECEAAFVLGFATRQRGFIAESLRVVEAGYALARTESFSWSLSRYPMLYGAVLADRGKLDRAAKVAREGIDDRCSPSTANAAMWVILGAVLALQEKFSEAEEAIERGYEVALRGGGVRLAAEILREKPRLHLIREDLHEIGPDLDRARAASPSIEALTEVRIFRAIVLEKEGRHEAAEEVARTVRGEEIHDTMGAAARAVLLRYELMRFEHVPTLVRRERVETSLRILFAPDDRGATWYQKCVDVRICFMASVSRLEAFGFKNPSSEKDNIVLELPYDPRLRRARLGKTTIDHFPAAAFRILLTLAQRQQVSLSLPRAFSIAWPGDALDPAGMRNRVHVAMSFLRKNFLGELLVRDDSGYALDPRVIITWTD